MMKRKNVNIILLFVTFLWLFSCKEPLPTELLTDDNAQNTTDEFTVEVVAADPDEMDYSNGYDSTGILSTTPQDFFSIISFSKVTDEFNGRSRVQDNAIAIFFDKNNPVYSMHNKIIGYKTRKIGDVLFNGDTANVKALKIGYFREGMPREITLGPMHQLKRNLLLGETPIAEYGSQLNIKIISDLNNNTVEGNIPIPREINAGLVIRGKKSEKNLELILTWENPRPGKDIEIILGGVRYYTQKRMPILKIKTKDDGRLIIPQSIFKNFRYEFYSHLIVTLMRRIEIKSLRDTENNKAFISSQTIQNLIFNVP